MMCRYCRFYQSSLGAGLALVLCGLLAPSAPAQPAAQGWRTVTVAEGIRHPWGLAWLPDGRALITGKYASLHVLNGTRFESIPMEGLPSAVTNEGPYERENFAAS